MRRFLLLVVLIGCLAVSSGGAKAEQGSWRTGLSLYSGQFYDIVYASRTTIWAAGPGGILLSEDSGGSWHWAINATVTAVDSAGDGKRGWAVGEQGKIFATSDGGKTWNPQTSGTDRYLFSISVFDSQHAITMGADPPSDVPMSFPPNVVLLTDDGGASWAPVQFAEKLQLRSLAVLKGGSKAWLSATRCNPDANAPNGCTLGANVLLVSKDYGHTWKEIGSQTLWDMQFTSESTGWALQGSMVRTTDGGKSWRTVRSNEGDIYLSDLFALDDDTAFAMEGKDPSVQQLIKTTDGGETWTKIAEPATFALQLSFFDATKGVRSEWNRTIQWTGDGGATWHDASVPTFATSMWLPLDFIDTQKGWAPATKLLRTHDGGASWEKVSDQQFDVVDFVSETEGWAAQTIRQAGPWPTSILHTVDGGATWTEQIRRQGSDVAQIKFVDRLNGWVTMGSDKPALHTRDGGLTWTEQLPPGRLVVAGDASTVWAASEPAATGGSNSYVSVSYDGGYSWAQVGSFRDQGGGMPLAAFGQRDAWFVSNHWDAGNSSSTIYRTQDGGASWQELPTTSYGYDSSSARRRA
jgi:photosystem II stability/assembly factor-like uncharacterized protein